MAPEKFGGESVKLIKAFCVVAVALAGAGAGICVVIDGAHAATVNISGATPPFPGYNTASTGHNVIDGGLSGVTSGILGSSSFKGSVTGTPAVVTTGLLSYNVDWYFVGAESGFVNTLAAPGINPGGLLLNSPTAGQFNESNQNNNCPGCGHGTNSGPVFLGTSIGQTSSVLNFSFQDGHGANIANGSGNPNAGGSGVASIIFSYVTPGVGLSWVLSNDATSAWFLFAFNDGGGPDADFDDLVGVARVYCATPNGAACANIPQTPLPAALPLFAGGLGALGWFASRRKRKILEGDPAYVAC